MFTRLVRGIKEPDTVHCLCLGIEHTLSLQVFSLQPPLTCEATRSLADMIAIKAIVIASQCLCLSALADTTSTLQRLKPFLSSGATISSNTSGLPRLSSFDAPDPGAILNVATEEDVAVTVSSRMSTRKPSIYDVCSA